MVGYGRESEEGRRKTGTKENGGLKKKERENRRFCTTTNNLTNSRKGKTLGLLFLPRYRTKKNPKDLLKSVTSSPRYVPLLDCSASSVGRHALSRWSVVYFYCFFFLFSFFSAVDRHLPQELCSAARPGACPPRCHLPVPSGSPSSTLRRAMRLSSLPRRGIRSLPLCQAVAIAGAKSRGCYS